jgi:tetratricopeptide (TPR) repeat protein
VNRKILIIASCVIMLLTVIVLAFYKFSSPPAPEEVALKYLQSSTELIQQQEYEKALEELDKIFALPDGEPTAVVYLNRGIVYMNLKNLEKAVLDFETVLHEEPDHTEAHYFMCFTLVNMKELDRAEAACMEALKHGVELDEIRGLLVDIHLGRRDFDKAIVLLNEILEDNPQDHETMNQLAWILSTSPEKEILDLDKALGLSQKANEMTQNAEIEYLDTMACIHAAKGNFAEATKMAKEKKLNKREELFSQNQPCSFE